MIFSLLTLFGVVFVIIAVFAGLFAHKFWTLRDIVMISIGELAEVMELLKHYDEIENVDQHLARLAKMDPDEVAREIEKGNTMAIIGKVAANVLDNLRNSVPGGHEVIANARCTLMPPNCEAPK